MQEASTKKRKCHSNLAFVPSHPIPFRMASLSHEILLLSVKLQKRRTTAEWSVGEETPAIWRSNSRVTIKVKQGIFPVLSIAAK